jgi:hypothetical protein
MMNLQFKSQNEQFTLPAPSHAKPGFKIKI